MLKLYSQRYELKKYLTTNIFLHKLYYSNIVNLHRPVLCLPKDLLKGLMNLPTYVGPTCFFFNSTVKPLFNMYSTHTHPLQQNNGQAAYHFDAGSDVRVCYTKWPRIAEPRTQVWRYKRVWMLRRQHTINKEDIRHCFRFLVNIS